MRNGGERLALRHGSVVDCFGQLANLEWARKNYCLVGDGRRSFNFICKEGWKHTGRISSTDNNNSYKLQDKMSSQSIRIRHSEDFICFCPETLQNSKMFQKHVSLLVIVFLVPEVVFHFSNWWSIYDFFLVVAHNFLKTDVSTQRSHGLVHNKIGVNILTMPPGTIQLSTIVWYHVVQLLQRVIPAIQVIFFG